MPQYASCPTEDNVIATPCYSGQSCTIMIFCLKAILLHHGKGKSSIATDEQFSVNLLSSATIKSGHPDRVKVFLKGWSQLFSYCREIYMDVGHLPLCVIMKIHVFIDTKKPVKYVG